MFATFVSYYGQNGEYGNLVAVWQRTASSKLFTSPRKATVKIVTVATTVQITIEKTIAKRDLYAGCISRMTIVVLPSPFVRFVVSTPRLLPLEKLSSFSMAELPEKTGLQTVMNIL